MSISENPTEIGGPEDAQEIPDKLYFRIGEVARLAGIKPYVLRFWETEFPGLGPKKSGTGHRLYRRKEVELALEIKRLLYEQRFTIEGARKHLESRTKPEGRRASAKPGRSTAEKRVKVQGDLFNLSAPFAEQIRSELQEILKLLK